MEIKLDRVSKKLQFYIIANISNSNKNDFITLKAKSIEFATHNNGKNR